DVLDDLAAIGLDRVVRDQARDRVVIRRRQGVVVGHGSSGATSEPRRPVVVGTLRVPSATARGACLLQPTSQYGIHPWEAIQLYIGGGGEGLRGGKVIDSPDGASSASARPRPRRLPARRSATGSIATSHSGVSHISQRGPLVQPP